MSQDNCNISVEKKELEVILQKELGKSLIIKNHTYKLANEKGKNYGSLLLSIAINVQYPENEESEILHVLAKLAPPTEFLQTMFDFPVTFCKEMNFYKLIIPAYACFERENNVHENNRLDITPPFFGARTSLSGDDDDIANSSAMLLMGDMRTRGYRVVNQLYGLDLNHCELAVSKLAQFHALPIALRQRKPIVYEQTVKKVAAVLENPAFNLERDKFRNEFLSALQKHNPNLYYYFDKIRKRVEHNDQNYNPLEKEPYATVVHNDLWTNNLLFSYADQRNSSTPTDVKIIDFQGTVICSPVKDIIFFLYSSAEESVLGNYLDHLMSIYFENLMNKLKELHCDTDKFSKKDFDEEISHFAPTQFYHIIVMLTVIYADKNEIDEIHNVTSFDKIMFTWNTLSKHKLENTIKLFEKQNWL